VSFDVSRGTSEDVKAAAGVIFNPSFVGDTVGYVRKFAPAPGRGSITPTAEAGRKANSFGVVVAGRIARRLSTSACRRRRRPGGQPSAACQATSRR